MKPYQPRTWLALVCITALLSACVSWPEHSSGRVVVADDNRYVDIRINDRDRDAIHRYYSKRGKSKGLPPGLAKKGKVPPGHAKKLARHDRLPPGIAYRNLPAELEQNLSSLPQGYVRVRVGQELVLMDKKTRVILDVVSDLQ